ncbi:MAG: hypothetical protein AAFU64_10475 [Bacteroidota bacterium]
MNSINVDNTQREFVWKINTANPVKEKSTSSEPRRVKDIVEKTFKKLSAQLLDRVNKLEGELSQLKAENAELKSKLNQEFTQVSQIA